MNSAYIASQPDGVVSLIPENTRFWAGEFYARTHTHTHTRTRTHAHRQRHRLPKCSWNKLNLEGGFFFLYFPFPLLLLFFPLKIKI